MFVARAGGQYFDSRKKIVDCGLRTVDCGLRKVAVDVWAGGCRGTELLVVNWVGGGGEAGLFRAKRYIDIVWFHRKASFALTERMSVQSSPNEFFSVEIE
jgi:protein gp37